MSHSRQRQEVYWVLRAQSGDAQALDMLLKAVQQPVFRHIVGIMGDQALAQDVLQEVFLLVFRKLPWLREPTAFRAWVYRIASRQATNALRRRRPTERLWNEEIADRSAESYTGNEEGPNSDLLDRLPSVLEDLSPASRTVLNLHYREGMKLREVAEVLELSLGTVKSRLAYGLRQLREKLNHEDPQS
jgi:RNA polymerase sigma-70 factor (ECF subfamily)